MIFTLDPDERARYRDWNTRHLNEKHGGSEPWGGAIGGRLTFKITPTSIGTILKVECACGASEILTDLEAF